jgi:hypothetical protein
MERGSGRSPPSRPVKEFIYSRLSLAPSRSESRNNILGAPIVTRFSTLLHRAIRATRERSGHAIPIMNALIRIQPRPHRQIEPEPAPRTGRETPGRLSVGNQTISKRVAMMWLALLRAYAVRYLHAIVQIARGEHRGAVFPKALRLPSAGPQLIDGVKNGNSLLRLPCGPQIAPAIKKRRDCYRKDWKHFFRRRSVLPRW